MTTPKKTLTYYHAGPLFTISDLTTNISLSNLISTLTSTTPTSSPPSSATNTSTSPNTNTPTPSQPTPQSPYHFSPLLPQSLEPRTLHPHSIRDSDLRALLSCDLALFIYDGAELDAGTVVEYMVAKFADVPSVICRTDFRGGGDQGTQMKEGGDGDGKQKGEVQADAWNLMSSFWPRTKTLRVDSMTQYKTALSNALAAQNAQGQTQQQDLAAANTIASEALLRYAAGEIIEAMNEVVSMKPRLPMHLREGVYEWIAGMVGWRESEDAGGSGSGEGWREGGMIAEMRKMMEGKVERGIL